MMGDRTGPSVARGWVHIVVAALLVSFGCVVANVAHAQVDDDTQRGVPIWKHSLKWWMQHGYWRLGGGEFVYAGSTSDAFFNITNGPATLGVTTGSRPNSGGGVSSHEMLAAGTIGFIIPAFGEHFSVEAFLAAPLKLNFETRGTLGTEPVAQEALTGNSGDPLTTGVPAIGRAVGSLHALPPNFTIVYRPFLDTFVRPYVGVGAYWMYTYSMKIQAPVLANPEITSPQLTLTRPVGCIAQAGLDVKLPWGFYLTADARYLACATVHAVMHNVEVFSPQQSPVFGTIPVGDISMDNHMRALLFSVTIGSTFWGDW